MTLLILILAVTVLIAVAAFAVQKKIDCEHAAAERKQWKDAIREKTSAVYDALIDGDENVLARLRYEFITLLDPSDRDDREIFESIRPAPKGEETAAAEAFAERIALLLQYDLTRTRLETGAVAMRFDYFRKLLGQWLYRPARKRYTGQSVSASQTEADDGHENTL